MATDLLEKLADLPVPPAPPPLVFDREIHKRINSRLIVGQTLDLLLRGFGFGIAHFFKAVLGLIRLTLTGKLDAPKNDRDLPRM
ncbi:MAG TPA: hypothetical protein VGJ04_08235 [Pirellulales bacterium]|jgi:hypothetical protein